MSDQDDKDLATIVFPEGRVINCALFVKDKFDEKATPQYKIEMAYDPDDLIKAEDQIVDFAIAQWGKKAEDQYNDGKIKTCIIEGDDLAEKREDKGKEGNAYKGKLVIRSNTQFNKNGDNDAGGIEVYDESVEPIEPIDHAKVYPGCYGVVAGTIAKYENNEGKKALKIYLNAFQKTKDGERLATSSDRSSAFKPVAGNKSSSDDGRRRRRG